jgi:hypothetical protein
MMKALIIGAVALVSLTMISGCASIANGKTQKIDVSASNGQNITGNVDGKTFNAPSVVIVDRANMDKVLRVDNPECEKEVALKKTVSPMFFGNILIGGLLGSTTDNATGSMWQYQDKVVVPCK